MLQWINEIMARKECHKNVFNTKWRKSVVPERFIKILKNKIYKYMTSISKNVYIDKLDDIINKYDNAYHRTIENETGWCKAKLIYWL